MNETLITNLKITETIVKGRKIRFLVLQIGEEALTLGFIDQFCKVHFYIY